MWATTVKPTGSESHPSKRGWQHHNNEEYDLAIIEYEKTIDSDPENAPFDYNRVIVNYDKGDLDRTIADYTRAIELSPSSALAYYNCGLAYEGYRAHSPRNVH